MFIIYTFQSLRTLTQSFHSYRMNATKWIGIVIIIGAVLAIVVMSVILAIRNSKKSSKVKAKEQREANMRECVNNIENDIKSNHDLTVSFSDKTINSICECIVETRSKNPVTHAFYQYNREKEGLDCIAKTTQWSDLESQVLEDLKAVCQENRVCSVPFDNIVKCTFRVLRQTYPTYYEYYIAYNNNKVDFNFIKTHSKECVTWDVVRDTARAICADRDDHEKCMVGFEQDIHNAQIKNMVPAHMLTVLLREHLTTF